MTVRDENPFNPWPRIGWGMVAAVLVVSAVIGFGLLGRYQLNGPTLDLWAAICRGVGLSADNAPAQEPAPAPRTPTRIAWDRATRDQIAAGDLKHGEFVAYNCAGCHGRGGKSTSALFPTLAGMDAAVIYKQLDDFRVGKRRWGVMEALAKPLSAQDSADVAAYLAAQPGGLAAPTPNLLPASEHGLQESDPARRLVYAGDPRRGIAPCAACHGPAGYKLGAPLLHGQHAAYIERQLEAFVQDLRVNDIFSQMRVIAKQLTPEEIRALAAFYGATADARHTATSAAR